MTKKSELNYRLAFIRAAVECESDPAAPTERVIRGHPGSLVVLVVHYSGGDFFITNHVLPVLSINNFTE